MFCVARPGGLQVSAQIAILTLVLFQHDDLDDRRRQRSRLEDLFGSDVHRVYKARGWLDIAIQMGFTGACKLGLRMA